MSSLLKQSFSFMEGKENVVIINLLRGILSGLAYPLLISKRVQCLKGQGGGKDDLLSERERKRA